MRLLFVSLTFLYAALPVSAQEKPLPGPPAASPSTAVAPLTVDEATRIGVQNNPRVIAGTREVGSATSGVRSARALTNPNAFFAPGVTSVSRTGEEFLIQQPLEINGTRKARAGIAEAQLRAAKAQTLVTLRDVVFTTKSVYYELARAREQASVAREAQGVAQEFDRLARRQVEEGVRPGIDLAQTGLEVSRAQRQVTLAEGQETVALAAFNTALGRDPSTPVGLLTPLLPLPPESAKTPDIGSTTTPPASSLTSTPSPQNPPVAGAVDSSTKTLLSQSLTARAEIQEAQATGEQFRQEARLARAEGRPDLVPQFRIGYFTRGLQSASEGNGAGIGIALTLPLLDHGSRRNRIQQAEQAASAQDARVLAVQNEVRQQVAGALARQRAAEEVVRSYPGGALDQARRLLEGSRIGFREGRTSIVALLEAQRSFRAVQNEYINALADAAIARAEVERATGSFSTTPPQP